jgi:hypothetical protein
MAALSLGNGPQAGLDAMVKGKGKVVSVLFFCN